MKTIRENAHICNIRAGQAQVRTANLSQLTWMRVGGIASYLPIRNLRDIVLAHLYTRTPAEINSLAATSALTETSSTAHKSVDAHTRPLVLGAGANIIAASGNIATPIIGMRSFRGIHRIDTRNTNSSHASHASHVSKSVTPDATSIQVLAGEEVGSFVRKVSSWGFAGIAKLYGLPGTIGGALWMNANCFKVALSSYATKSLVFVEDPTSDANKEDASLKAFSSIGELLNAWPVLKAVSADIYASKDAKNKNSENTEDQITEAELLAHVRERELPQADFSYKRSPFQGRDWIILAAEFSFSEKEEVLKLWALMHETYAYRKKNLHFAYPSAGSVFKNNYDYGVGTGQILDKIGLKGTRVGGAQVSPHHGNFIINTGNATGEDVHALISIMHDACLEKRKLKIEPEVIMWGF